MRNWVIFGGFIAIAAFAQEKTSGQKAPPASPLVCVASIVNQGDPVINYGADDVQILGALDYGETSKPAIYSAKPPYRAFVFSGYGCQVVDITLKGDAGKPFLALADSSLKEIAHATTHLNVRLPFRGPDIEVWYIIFKDSDDKPASFTVQVKKTEDIPEKGSSPAVAPTN